MLPLNFQFIRGYLRIRVIGYSPERFLNACRHHGIDLWGVESVSGDYEMFISVPDFRKLRSIVKRTGARVVIIERLGLPFYFVRLQSRKIFVCGAVLCVAAIYLFSMFVWSIDVTGNRKYTDESLLSFLETRDIHAGMLLSHVDCDRIVKEIRENYDEIVWVSASVDGCRVIVRIKENEDSKEIIDRPEPKSGNHETGTDIVADFDGTITELIVRQGLPCVREGDSVVKGQVLVTGVVPVIDDAGEIVDYQWKDSDADIRAERIVNYQKIIDRTHKEKVYQPEKKHLFYLRIGSYILRLGMAGNSLTAAEEHTTEYGIYRKDFLRFPFYVGLRTIVPYKEKSKKYDNQELQYILSSAYARFREELLKKGVEIIENDVKIYTESEQVKASGTLKINADIGVKRTIHTVEEE